MNQEEVIDLYRYNDWANHRILSAAGQLPSEAYLRFLGGSFPTLRDTLSHLVAVEWVWLERWGGRSPASPPVWISSPKLSVLVDQLRDVEARRNCFLASLSTDSLAVVVPFRLIDGSADAHTLRDLLVHVVNHSTYHRGQMANMLRQVGSAAPATDFIAFRAASRSTS